MQSFLDRDQSYREIQVTKSIIFGLLLTHASQEIHAVGSHSPEVTKDSFHRAQRMSITCSDTQDFMVWRLR